MGFKPLKKHKELDVDYNPLKKIKINLDSYILNMFIGYVFTDNPNVTKMNLSNLHKLVDMIDIRQYRANKMMYSKIEFLLDALEAKLQKGINKKDILKTYCVKENNPDTFQIVREVDGYAQLTNQDVKFITDAVSDRLKYCFILVYKEIIVNQFMRLDTGDFNSFSEITDEVKERCSSLLNDIRKADQTSTDNQFSLGEGFERLVEATVYDSVNPSSVLVTGIKTLNDLLSPGYMPGRLYMYLGITGGWKSVMLLSTCHWIKKYNRVEPKEDGKRPTVLYISNENSISESIIRLFNMTVTDNDITNYEPADVVQMMREQGGLCLKDDNDIDIVMQYYGNMEISTADMYGIIEDLEDDGREVICVVLDYIKRIRSAQKALDERSRLGYVSNELKDLAVRLRIPVITAQQINRAGNMTIDAASESGKEDLARFLGRGNIAESWDMLQNIDWAAILNIEIERSTDVRYLTVKEIKKRYKAQTPISYFNQPFKPGSTIQLVEDFFEDKPAAKLSLASDLVGVNMKAEAKSEKAKTINKEAINDGGSILEGLIN